MLNNVKFQSHLHHMGNMFEGCYTADWDGKSLCIVVNISPKADEFLSVSTNEGEIINFTTSELREAGKSHIPFEQLINEYLTENPLPNE